MLTPSSRAVAVTVFSNRARITRRAEAPVPAGSVAVKLGRLPLTLQTDSVRVNVFQGQARIVSVDVTSDFFAETPEGSVATLEAQLENLTGQLRAAEDNDQAQTGRIEMAKALATAASAEFAKGLAFGRSGVQQIESMSAYVLQEQREAAAEKRTLAIQKAALNRQIEAVRGQLNRVRQPVRQERRAIVVHLEALEAGTLLLDATYVVTNARWSPMYDLRLSGEQVAVTYLAAVSQSTGEEWTGVELSLSTAQPAVSAKVPELNPWYVELAPPPPPVFADVMRPAAMMRSKAMLASGGSIEDEATPEMMMMAAAPAPAPLAAEVASSGASVTYKCQRPVTIPGDGSTNRPLIAEFRLPAKLDHITVPKLAEEAYLRAVITNNSPYVLLPGPASVFHEEEYVSNTALNLTARDEEFKVQLGVDSRIKVKRELTSRDTSKNFFIGNTRKIEFGYRIEVQNLSGQATVVAIEDQTPHSRHEDVKVKLASATPKPAEQTDLGILRWKAALKPQEKAEVRFEFTVEHPRHVEIIGLT